ncbi:phosphopentomutase [Peptococcus simiae]|uniref:phosphopentomutase n=1 Tax=Peptococcus simiae TaxID=1643805 RepID=UPI0039814A7C
MKVIMIVLDSVGVGASPDAGAFGDPSSVNTLASALKHLPQGTSLKNLEDLGFIQLCQEKPEPGRAITARALEASKGKDTVVGHWELAGKISDRAFPTFPQGFPEKMVDHIKSVAQRDVLWNKPASGTAIIQTFGDEHLRTGALIVYTSSDSVLQIAAHEDIVPLDELYRICAQLRQDFSAPEEEVNRIIARPFIGPSAGPFTRTENRRDFTVPIPAGHLLDDLAQTKVPSYAVGKIKTIFPNVTFTGNWPGHNNAEALASTLALAQEVPHGLIFTNLVDFDMLYGHRRNPEGYAQALLAFDRALPDLLASLQEEDWLILTADHGCDPLAPGTDHTREKIPVLFYSPRLTEGKYIGERTSYADIASTIADLFAISYSGAGSSFKEYLDT